MPRGPTRRPVPRRPRGPAAAGHGRAATATLEQRLAAPQPDARLEAQFGAARHAELRALAAAAPRRPVGRRVLILPGIMGSALGRNRALLPDDLLWFDPVEIALGHLTQLVPPSKRVLEARGPVLFGYLRLKLALRAAGHDARFFAFDWRHSLREAAARLAAEVGRSPRGTALVAHSLGGLVARALLAHPQAARVARVVQLGTPNRGAFAAVQALRGTYPLVRRLARLDLAHGADTLARRVLTQLTGLAELLPEAAACEGIDPFDVDQWPAGPTPPARVLDAARAARSSLPAPDARFALIAGYGHDTPVALRLANGQLQFATDRTGDGTVPLALAQLPGLAGYYTPVAHGELPSDATVSDAVLDLVDGGHTTVLPTQPAVARVPRRWRSERAVADEPKLYWDDLDDDERRGFLHEFIALAPPRDPRALARRLAPGGPPVRLVLEVADVTAIRADAIVLAQFDQVDPAGATLDVDQALGGTIRDLAAHRALGTGPGEIFMLPVPRGRLHVQQVVLAGLGGFREHDAVVRRRAAANAVRALALSGLRDLAFLLWGTASGVAPAEAATSLVAGFADALAELEPAQRPRRLRIVSRSPRRLQAARTAIEALLPTLAGAGQLLLAAPQPRAAAPRRRTRPAPATACAYLFAQQRDDTLQLSLLGPADKGTALHGSQKLERRRLESVLAGLDDQLTARELARVGTELAGLLLPANLQAGLLAVAEAALVVVHDAAASLWPWEALHLDGHAPAAGHGLCRRYAAEGLSVARWAEQRQSAAELAVLLITNPTEDLAGAAREGAAVRTALARLRRARLTEITGREATRARLLGEFRSGRYDVVHYAGHAFFEPGAAERSGILCAGGGVLSGAELAGLESLPALMFFNACESGRIRGRGRARRAALERGAGLAEAFLRAGLANYLGTWWPVGDAAALEFARTLYTRLADGDALGAAVLAGRTAVRRQRSGDWANYLHYGGYDFRLKR